MCQNCCKLNFVQFVSFVYFLAKKVQYSTNISCAKSLMAQDLDLSIIEYSGSPKESELFLKWYTTQIYFLKNQTVIKGQLRDCYCPQNGFRLDSNSPLTILKLSSNHPLTVLLISDMFIVFQSHHIISYHIT